VEHDFKKVFEEKYSHDIDQKIKKLLARKIFDEQEISRTIHDFKGNFFLIMKLYALEVRFESFMD
jgi:hypothetical protein